VHFAGRRCARPGGIPESGFGALLLEAEFLLADSALDGLLAFQPVGPFGLQVLDLGCGEGTRDAGAEGNCLDVTRVAG
jgi:hypothetical protein